MFEWRNGNKHVRYFISYFKQRLKLENRKLLWKVHTYFKCAYLWYKINMTPARAMSWFETKKISRNSFWVNIMQRVRSLMYIKIDTVCKVSSSRWSMVVYCFRIFFVPFFDMLLICLIRKMRCLPSYQVQHLKWIQIVQYKDYPYIIPWHFMKIDFFFLVPNLLKFSAVSISPAQGVLQSR